jgi:hypothetical protein
MKFPAFAWTILCPTEPEREILLPLVFSSKTDQLRKRIDIPYGPVPERKRPLQF